MVRLIVLCGWLCCVPELYAQTCETIENDSIANALANQYVKEGRFSQADTLYRNVLRVRAEKYGNNSPEYAETLSGMAELYIDKQEYPQAKAVLDTVLRIQKVQPGIRHPAYANSLGILGLYHALTGNFCEAQQLLEESTAILRKTPGENHPDYAQLISRTGVYYFLTSDFASAEKHYAQAADIFKKALGETHSDCLMNRIAVGTCRLAAGDYTTAESISLELLPVVESNFGKQYPGYTTLLSNLGNIYKETGQFEKAENIFRQSLRNTKEIYGQSHSYYFNDLNALAVLYYSNGYPDKAEPLLLQSLKLRKKLYGENHPGTANALNSLGIFYMQTLNYAQAERYLLESLESLQHSLGEETLNYINSLTNLAHIYIDTQHWHKALNLLSEKEPMICRTLGENHRLYIRMQNFMAEIAGHMEAIEGDTTCHAEARFLELLRKTKNVFGEDHSEYIMSLHNLTVFYTFRKQFEKAEELLVQYLHQRENEDEKRYSILLSQLAFVRCFAGKPSDALHYYTNSFNQAVKETERNFTFLSEMEKEIFWEIVSQQANTFHSLTAKYQKEAPAAAALSYNCELLTKSLLLNSSRHVYQSILNGQDEKLTEWWESLSAYKKALLKMRDTIRKMEDALLSGTGMSFREFEEAVAKTKDRESQQLVDEINSYKRQQATQEADYQKMEKDIISRSEKSGTKQELSFRWEDVQQALQNDEAAIEFTRVEKIEFPEMRVSPASYHALIVRPGYKYPEMIYLCTEQELDSALMQTPCRSEKLRQLVWEPLEKQVRDVRSFYLAPSGLLCKVSFAGMKNGDRYLCDDCEIHCLLSTKDIIDLKRHPHTALSGTGKAALFGGADFALPPEQPAQANGTRGQGFAYLPGSAQEVKHIKNLLDSLQWETSLYIDREATETHFKALSSAQSPELLHISTHGFYFPPLQKEKTYPDVQTPRSEHENAYRSSGHPLMRCGLAFAGANRAWTGKEPHKNADDGILTAYEISNMNLAATQLVVLSACETGLGDISGGEGVYGLQRAFRLAGVAAAIVSLWEVPDRETAELMTTFYSLRNSETGIYKAFSTAQQQMRKKYPDTPEKWAGFVLFE
ncbi:MAG: CHAT domain-containing protein [Dysgonamonadaceae bacterium]|jgi:CHAT domain-containing protein|nr:CHAT domain-containing protein [Dysgonamonadaceae bacterium]